MISIITAVYNQLPMNKLFYEKLKEYTKNTFELIIIDNGSNDGSAEFFELVGAIVVRNNANYSYPYCQNRGIEVAQYDWLCFLNNDIIVSKNWDQYIIDSMLYNDLDVATVCGVEHLENRQATRYIRRRWNKIKCVLSVFGQSRFILKAMHSLMYLSWERFTESRHKKFHYNIKQGFVGNTVVIKKAALAKIGMWDERVQAADFDLYLRTIERYQNFGDIKPVHICLDVFVHHYIRLTAKVSFPPFNDITNLISIDDKWSIEMRQHFATMND